MHSPAGHGLRPPTRPRLGIQSPAWQDADRRVTRSGEPDLLARSSQSSTQEEADPQQRSEFTATGARPRRPRTRELAVQGWALPRPRPVRGIRARPSPRNSALSWVNLKATPGPFRESPAHMGPAATGASERAGRRRWTAASWKASWLKMLAQELPGRTATAEIPEGPGRNFPESLDQIVPGLGRGFPRNSSPAVIKML
ncbi:hypothetical protein NN561_018906 [Cricetulus griseus]